MKQERTKFTCRIEQDLLDRIGIIAEQNHRSTNSQIIVAIEEFLTCHESTSSEQESQQNSK